MGADFPPTIQTAAVGGARAPGVIDQELLSEGGRADVLPAVL